MADKKPKVPEITPQWGTGTSSGYTFTWPDAAYLQQLGLPKNVADSIGGTKLVTTGLPKTYGGIVQGIVEQLGDDNARKFFQPWIDQGFNPFAYRNAKKLSQFNREARTFMPTVLSKGYSNVDPSKFVTGGYATPGTPGPAGTVVGSGGGTSAYGVIAQKLSDYGMEDLIPKFYDYVFKSGVTDGRQLLQALRQEPEYKQTFIGLDKYNATNPRPMTEAQYLATAQKMLDVADAYGLPRSFFSKQEIGKLIAGGVSATEFNRRLADGYQVAVNADPATKAYLQRQGVDMGHLLAYFLDPKKAEPILTQKATTAQLQGYAQNVGVKSFSEAMAEELARGARTKVNADGTFTPAEEKKALDFAGAGAQLTGAAPGANAPTVNTTQLIGSQLAGFGGTTQAQAEQQVQRAAQGQAAPFQGGGGYEASQRGVTGIGSAPQ